MTAIDDTEEPIDRDAGKQARVEQPEQDERRDPGPAQSDDARAREREDPFALDPLSPPSGRPW